jgi:hypothetical protein
LEILFFEKKALYKSVVRDRRQCNHHRSYLGDVNFLVLLDVEQYVHYNADKNTDDGRDYQETVLVLHVEEIAYFFTFHLGVYKKWSEKYIPNPL